MSYRGILVTLLTVCSLPQSSAHSVTSSSVSVQSSTGTAGGAQRSEITLRGARGVAQVAGDKIELKDGLVFVNGVSFGAVPQGAEVKYVVTENGRTLFVGGEVRSGPK